MVIASERFLPRRSCGNYASGARGTRFPRDRVRHPRRSTESGLLLIPSAALPLPLRCGTEAAVFMVRPHVRADLREYLASCQTTLLATAAQNEKGDSLNPTFFPLRSSHDVNTRCSSFVRAESGAHGKTLTTDMRIRLRWLQMESRFVSRHRRQAQRRSLRPPTDIRAFSNAGG